LVKIEISAFAAGEPCAVASAACATGASRRKLWRAKASPPERRASIFTNAVAALTKKARGLEAPFAAADAVRAAIELPFDEGLKKEREGFLKLVSSDQSKAQRYAFFSEREAPRSQAFRMNRAAQCRARRHHRRRTMGGGIAMSFANAGIPVTLIETARNSSSAAWRDAEELRGHRRAGGIPADAPAKRMG